MLIMMRLCGKAPLLVAPFLFVIHVHPKQGIGSDGICGSTGPLPSERVSSDHVCSRDIDMAGLALKLSFNRQDLFAAGLARGPPNFGSKKTVHRRRDRDLSETVCNYICV